MLPVQICTLAIFSGHFFSVSPVKKYKEDHQNMDGVVCEDGDGILLNGNHGTLVQKGTKILELISMSQSTFSTKIKSDYADNGCHIR